LAATVPACGLLYVHTFVRDLNSGRHQYCGEADTGPGARALSRRCQQSDATHLHDLRNRARTARQDPSQCSSVPIPPAVYQPVRPDSATKPLPQTIKARPPPPATGPLTCTYLVAAAPDWPGSTRASRREPGFQVQPAACPEPRRLPPAADPCHWMTVSGAQTAGQMTVRRSSSLSGLLQICALTWTFWWAHLGSNQGLLACKTGNSGRRTWLAVALWAVDQP
jgi:hypothetical protein